VNIVLKKQLIRLQIPPRSKKVGIFLRFLRSEHEFPLEMSNMCLHLLYSMRRDIYSFISIHLSLLPNCIYEDLPYLPWSLISVLQIISIKSSPFNKSIICLCVRKPLTIKIDILGYVDQDSHVCTLLTSCLVPSTTVA